MTCELMLTSMLLLGGLVARDDPERAYTAALAQFSAGDHVAALASARFALDGSRAVAEVEGQTTAAVLELIAAYELRTGRKAEARQHLREALRILQRKYTQNHPRVVLVEAELNALGEAKD